MFEKNDDGSFTITPDMLPSTLKLKIKLGNIEDAPDDSGDGLIPIEYEWLNLEEVLQEFVLAALKAGLEKDK